MWFWNHSCPKSPLTVNPAPLATRLENCLRARVALVGDSDTVELLMLQLSSIALLNAKIATGKSIRRNALMPRLLRLKYVVRKGYPFTK